jgi:pimeloyl-ACP methyl ester carboxylesterase
VLLHGFCEDSSVWEPMLPLLSDTPVIRMDLPGFGGSDLPASIQLRDYAHDIHSALQLLGIQRCVLVGHSLGGYVALEYLKHYGEYLAGMGLFHSHPYPDNETQINNRRRGIETLQQGKRDLYVAQLFPGLFAPDFREKHPEIIQQMTEMGRRQTTAGIIAALEAMIARPSNEQTLKTASCPVQFILGEKDALIPLENGLKAAILPPSSNLQVLPGVGHMGIWEATETCAGMVAAFYAASER